MCSRYHLCTVYTKNLINIKKRNQIKSIFIMYNLHQTFVPLWITLSALSASLPFYSLYRNAIRCALSDFDRSIDPLYIKYSWTLHSVCVELCFVRSQAHYMKWYTGLSIRSIDQIWRYHTDWRSFISMVNSVYTKFSSHHERFEFAWKIKQITWTVAHQLCGTNNVELNGENPKPSLQIE